MPVLDQTPGIGPQPPAFHELAHFFVAAPGRAHSKLGMMKQRLISRLKEIKPVFALKSRDLRALLLLAALLGAVSCGKSKSAADNPPPVAKQPTPAPSSPQPGAVLPSGPSTEAPPAALAHAAPQASHTTPNIILILADDLGYGDLGCYGQGRFKTPNLDQMASEGIRFTNFYAGDTVCAPSRCALMTGLDTGHSRIRGNGNVPLEQGDVTVAEVLAQAGFRTCLIGKWGLGGENTTGLPQKKGFYEFAGFLDQVHAHNYYPDWIYHYAPQSSFEGHQVLYENMDNKRGIYIDDLFNKAAGNFIRINKPDQFNKYRPFFLFLSYTIPHANNEEAERTGNGMQVPSDSPYSVEAWPQPEKNKAAMITRMDAAIGALLAQLQKEKIDDRTIVFFSSDNGPHKEGGVDPNFFQSAGSLRGYKRDLYEGGIRVPFIARWPGHIKPGQVSGELGAFWDFLPTAAALAGTTNIPPNLDGISLAPTLLGETQTNHHSFLYWEFHERGFQQAGRLGDWKALRPQAGEPLELYNLRLDPREQHNVAAENPKVIARLETLFKQARIDSPDWPIKPKPPEAADKTNEGK